MQMPVLLILASSQSWQVLLPQRAAGNWSKVTPLSRLGSMYSMLGVYSIHTTCTHLGRGEGPHRTDPHSIKIPAIDGLFKESSFGGAEFTILK